MKGHRVTATLTNADPSAAPTTHHPVRTREQAVGRALAVVLGLLTIFGPISMDLYLPVLLLATVYLISYSGAAIPGLIAGRLTPTFTLIEIAAGYAALAVAACAVTVVASRPAPAAAHS
jgi:DHA1 family bicyclomycin/chloramphenicol resistance-like MFS transporter